MCWTRLPITVFAAAFLITGEWSEFSVQQLLVFSRLVGRDVKHALVHGGGDASSWSTCAHTSIAVWFVDFHSNDQTQESLSCLGCLACYPFQTSSLPIPPVSKTRRYETSLQQHHHTDRFSFSYPRTALSSFE